MIKFGNLTNPLNDVISDIQEIAKLGFDYVEIGIEGPCGKREILEKKINEIKAEIKKRNIFIVGHTAWYLEIGCQYEEIRKAYVEEMKKEMILAKRLGCTKVNLHSHCQGMYIRDEKSKKVIINNYIKSLRELVAYANKIGIRLMLENSGERGEITKFEDIKKIIDNVPGLYCHMDLGHVFIWDGMKGIEKYLKTFKNKLIHIHMHDNNGKQDEHIAIGKGKIDYKKVYKWIKEINYNNTITLEVFGKDRKAAVNSMSTLRKNLC